MTGIIILRYSNEYRGAAELTSIPAVATTGVSGRNPIALANLKAGEVEVQPATIDRLSLHNASVYVIISNCVVNLAAD